MRTTLNLVDSQQIRVILRKARELLVIKPSCFPWYCEPHSYTALAAFRDMRLDFNQHQLLYFNYLPMYVSFLQIIGAHTPVSTDYTRSRSFFE